MTKRRPDDHAADFWGYARSFLHGYMTKQRRLSAETVQSYRISIECLIGYLVAEQGVGKPDITFDHLEYPVLKAWVAWMSEGMSYSPKTIDLRITAVRSFLRYCATEDVALVDLYNKSRLLKGPKKRKKPIEHMGKEATRQILAAYDGSTAKSRRNRALLILLYDSAARVSELADAAVCDIRLDKPARMTVTGKGSKTRTVPLMEKTAEHMAVYLDEFHPGWRQSPGTDPLFYSLHGGRKVKLSTDTVSTVLKKAAAIASSRTPEVPDNVHCHLIRKTRAMDLYQQGVPLPIIMQLLGHESMSTTSGFYAFATNEMMFKAMAEVASDAVSEEPVRWTENRKLELLYSLR